MENKDLLFYKKKSFYEQFGEKELADAFEYAKGYASYLDDAKTEREAVERSIADAEKNGFVAYDFGMNVKTGGKYYYNNRGKNLFLFTVGSESL